MFFSPLARVAPEEAGVERGTEQPDCFSLTLFVMYFFWPGSRELRLLGMWRASSRSSRYIFTFIRVYRLIHHEKMNEMQALEVARIDEQTDLV